MRTSPSTGPPKQRLGLSALPLENLGPVTLAELALTAPLRRRANLVVLQPDGDGYVFLVKRGSLTLGAFQVPVEIGNAAVARLAILAGLDPLTEAEPGAGSTARLRVRAGQDAGELLLCITPTRDGLDAELRPLSVNGQDLERPARGHLKRCVQCAAFQPPQRQACEYDDGLLIDIADDPRPGGTIGAYRVGVRLGDGGMGTVLAGEHALIGRPVAIKLLHRSLADNPIMARRFLSEARAASRIRHLNVVDVTDFGLLSDGRPYMVMERLAGESLESRLDRLGALEPLTALLIGREVALALAAAHAGGVVHRDLKPANVIMLETAPAESSPSTATVVGLPAKDADGARGGPVVEAPRLKLVDFGAAYLTGMVSEEGDGIIGTPPYMSPEHARGEPTDGRTDIYSLGILLYEMLSGSPPFVGDSAREILLQHLKTPPPPLDCPGGALPQPVLRVVSRALRKNAGERHQTAEELVADLDRAVAAVGRRDWRKWLPT